jgi:23S rRNA pseudouridine2605 synthase
MSNSDIKKTSMRLNRFVSMSGISSRRAAEEIIRAGRISMNGETVTDPARSVTPGIDTVTMDGRTIDAGTSKRYYVVNKPLGVIVSVGDTHGRRTVMDIFGRDGRGLFPVGRLDQYTSGVLLVSDDGDLAHRLMHPSFGVEKVYHAQVKGVVSKETVRLFREGIQLEDGLTAPAALRILSHTDALSEVEVIIHQGRKRQVRRMLDEAGYPVRTLERIAFGGITTAGLDRGKYRPLTGEEIGMLKKSVGLDLEGSESDTSRGSVKKPGNHRQEKG